jgi:glycosyltransferase 2 family protein
MKKTLITLLKLSASLAILAYLIWKATRTRGPNNVDVFTNLIEEPKDWWMLFWAWAFSAAAVVLTFVRWWYLVRALGIPCRLSDGIRIGFWGYLFNLSPLGIVGGDLVKAVMLAHEHRQYRAKAAASVLFDRVIGLYVLFVLASAAILFTGFWRLKEPEIHITCLLTFIVTIGGAVGIALMYVPGVLDGPLSRALGRLPRVGRLITSLINAVGLYRYKPVVLIVSTLMCFVVQGSFATSVYLIARGLPGDVLSLGAHFVVWPLSSAAGVIPLSIGPTEFVLDFLYAHVPQAGVVIPEGQGLVVALCYRLITVLVAALGIRYYIGNRREVSEAIHEDQQDQPPA